jgi:hypothetical protein
VVFEAALIDTRSNGLSGELVMAAAVVSSGVVPPGPAWCSMLWVVPNSILSNLLSLRQLRLRRQTDARKWRG